MISIVTPFYNSSRYLYECIESVVNQTHPFWELLLINDGSTDNSKEIALSFVDPRIRYFEQKNQGVSSARNLGLRNIRGEYFCFLDADDKLPPESLSSRYKIFKKDREVDFVDGKVILMNNNFKIQLSAWTPSYRGNPLSDLVTLQGRTFFGPTWMIRRLPNINYFLKEGLTHAEDLLFFISLAKMGGKYSYTSEIILQYRNTPGSAMKNLTGLESGYRQVFDEIKHWTEIDKNDLSAYVARSRRIMFYSYLRSWHVTKALKVLFKWL